MCGSSVARVRCAGMSKASKESFLHRSTHLSVYPPAGRVRISAPLRMNLNTLRVFATYFLKWKEAEADNM